MKRKSISLICLILTALIFLLFLSSSGTGKKAEEVGWPRWRGPKGDGISEETNWDPEALAGGPKILWKADVGWGYSNVAIKDNRLYTMGKKGGENVVYCFNAETGKLIWRHSSVSIGEPHSTPTIEGEYVYALFQDGHLLCLNTKNGKLQWKKDLVSEYNAERPKYGFATSPVIEGDLLILNANTSGIALNKNTGDKIWDSDVHTIQLLEGYYATPVIYDGEGKRCALLFSGTGLFSVEVQTGNPFWFYEWSHPKATNAADPIVFENRVFISTCWGIENCALLNIKENKPDLLWHNENMRNYFSTCVYVDGYLYGSDGHTESKVHPFRCIDIVTGDVMWEKKMRMASLIAAGGKLIILEEDGTLQIAEAAPSSYKEISSGNVHTGERKTRKFWTPPVLYQGKIYCRNYAFDLVCIDVSK